jgi:hypothetical protein
MCFVQIHAQHMQWDLVRCTKNLTPQFEFKTHLKTLKHSLYFGDYCFQSL